MRKMTPAGFESGDTHSRGPKNRDSATYVGRRSLFDSHLSFYLLSTALTWIPTPIAIKQHAAEIRTGGLQDAFQLFSLFFSSAILNVTVSSRD